MNNRKPQKAQVSKKRPVHTYAELWHGAGVLLKRAQDEPKGSKWLLMGHLILIEFSFEAYLNHIGPKLFAYWKQVLEKKLSIENKIDLICERVGINLPKNIRPRKTVNELFKFRNQIAHGETISIEENTIRDIDQYLDEFIGIPPLTKWEKYCNENNSKIALEDIKKVMELIQKKANPKEPLFFSGISEASASLQQ
jgi:hypothetical protein